MDIDAIFSQLGKLGGAPGYALVTVFCIVVCMGLTKWKKFPNDGIWLTAVLLGGVLNSIIADPASDSLTFRVWLVKNAVFGSICGGVGALAHGTVIKKVLAKFGVNSDGNTETFTKDPAAPDPRDRPNWPNP